MTKIEGSLRRESSNTSDCCDCIPKKGKIISLIQKLFPKKDHSPSNPSKSLATENIMELSDFKDESLEVGRLTTFFQKVFPKKKNSQTSFENLKTTQDELSRRRDLKRASYLFDGDNFFRSSSQSEFCQYRP